MATIAIKPRINPVIGRVNRNAAAPAMPSTSTISCVA